MVLVEKTEMTTWSFELLFGGYDHGRMVGVLFWSLIPIRINSLLQLMLFRDAFRRPSPS